MAFQVHVAPAERILWLFSREVIVTKVTSNNDEVWSALKVCKLDSQQKAQINIGSYIKLHFDRKLRTVTSFQGTILL